MERQKKLRADRHLGLVTDSVSVTLGYLITAALFALPKQGFISYGVFLAAVLLILHMLEAYDDVSSYRMQKKRLPVMLIVTFFFASLIYVLIGLVLAGFGVFVPTVPECLLFFALSYGFMMAGRLFLNRLLLKQRSNISVLILYSLECPDRFLEKLTASLADYKSVETLLTGNVEEPERVGAAIDRSDILLIVGNASNAVRDSYILRALSAGKAVKIIPTIKALSFMHAKIDHVGDTPVIRLKSIRMSLPERILKRGFDFLMSFLGLVVLLPVFLVCALMIKLDSKGPVFYLQERYTRGKRRFRIVKFRTMLADAEKNGARLATEHDDRITRAGKILRTCRLDELPQLWNILKGDMSLVGPRPERPIFADEYSRIVKNYDVRYSVKAGLTGYAQIHGKYNTKASDKVLLDSLYISEFSPWLDLKLLVQTVYIMFIKESTEGVTEESAQDSIGSSPSSEKTSETNSIQKG